MEDREILILIMLNSYLPAGRVFQHQGRCPELVSGF